MVSAKSLPSGLPREKSKQSNQGKDAPSSLGPGQLWAHSSSVGEGSQAEEQKGLECQERVAVDRTCLTGSSGHTRSIGKGVLKVRREQRAMTSSKHQSTNHEEEGPFTVRIPVSEWMMDVPSYVLLSGHRMSLGNRVYKDSV